MPDGEIISCFIGQCGTQISSACWELYCLEHGISPDGDAQRVQNINADEPVKDPSQSFFKESKHKKFIPRTIIMDTEPNVVDEIRTGVYRGLFNPNTLITDLEDAASNFARGFYACARKIVQPTMQQLRKEVENADNLQGIMIYHSFGGGTGAGTTCKLLEAIDREFNKTPKIELTVYPSKQMCSSVVEPYNAVLCSSTADDTSDVTILVDNQALATICTEELHLERPSFSSLNRLIAQVSSGMTAAVRYEGPLTASLGQLQTNLVPFPRLHYLQSAMAPIISNDREMHEPITMQDLTLSLFSPSTQMLTGDPSSTCVLACALLCRGDIAVQEIRHAVSKLKQQGVVNMVSWCPTGFKIGLCLQPPIFVPRSGFAPVNRSVVGLYNSTLLVPPIQQVSTKVDCLLRKRAFLHWYLQEGMEEGEITNAQEGIKQLLGDFHHLERHGFPIEREVVSSTSQSSNQKPLPSTILVRPSFNVFNPSVPLRKKISSQQSSCNSKTPFIQNPLSLCPVATSQLQNLPISNITSHSSKSHSDATINSNHEQDQNQQTEEEELVIDSSEPVREYDV